MEHNMLTLDFWQDAVTYEGQTIPTGTLGCDALNIPDEIIEKLGLKALPFSKKNITDKVQYVVYSSAYKLDQNPDLIAASEKNIPCLGKRSSKMD